MRLHVSLFRHARDNIPEGRDIDWLGLRELIGTHRIRPRSQKTDAPALCPAEWPEGKRRAKDTVSRVWFGALDFDGADHEGATQAELDRILEAAEGLSTIFYTTWRHAEYHEKQGTWRFRLLVALTRPVEASEWKKFWPRLHARFGGLADDRCKDPSRLYFLPSAPSPKGCVVEFSDGTALDVDQLLEGDDPPESKRPTRTVGPADLEELAARLNRKRSPSLRAVADALKRALAGEPLAVPGARDDTLFRIACAVAEEWPDCQPAAVASLFARSLSVMGALSSDCPTVDDLAEKIDRKLSEAGAAREARQKERESVQRERIFAAFSGERSEPYSEDELDSFAREANTDRRGFMRRWLVQAGKSYYLFVDGQYGPALVREELVTTAERDLSPAASAGVSVWKVGERGDPKLKNPQELMIQYGETAQRVVVDLVATRSRYDLKERLMIEAPCPLRDLEPAESAEVAEWLEALGGSQHDRLLDWIAVVTHLDEPCAAVYLDGAPGTGKTLFADSLSRLWTEFGPTPLAEVVGNFNEHLLKCPLVLADEVLPDILKRTEGTGEMRQLIQARQQALRRKYCPTASIRGSVRLVLTANNRHLLDTSELLTESDTAAVAERILYIHASNKARRVLEKLGPKTVRRFVTKDLTAKHALWLRDNREVVREHRFLVSGTDSALHRSLTTGRGLASAICHWCVSYLQEPGKMDATKKLLVRIHKGELLVTAKALSEHWDMYPTNVKAPPPGRISRALSSLCGPKRQLVAGSGKPTNYWPVKTESLLTWADDMGYTTEEDILGAMAKDTDLTGLPEPGDEEGAPF